MEYLQYVEFGKVDTMSHHIVLNLIINGIPSIHYNIRSKQEGTYGFKPYYKWNTFNTIFIMKYYWMLKRVLNLIINGIPSIQIYLYVTGFTPALGFKPYYKWNTFNTKSYRNRT